MFHMIKFDSTAPAPTINLGLFGGVRIRYHFMLLDPNGGGQVLQEWRGNNWDKEKDVFTLPIAGAALKFAGLSWQFDIFPNPGISGQKYRVVLSIEQNNAGIFSREYEENVTSPIILTEDAVFVAA